MRGNIEGREARGTSNKIYLGRSSPRHKGGEVGEERGKNGTSGRCYGPSEDGGCGGHAHKGFRRADPNAIRCLRAHSTPKSQFQSTRDNAMVHVVGAVRERQVTENGRSTDRDRQRQEKRFRVSIEEIIEVT